MMKLFSNFKKNLEINSDLESHHRNSDPLKSCIWDVFFSPQDHSRLGQEQRSSNCFMIAVNNPAN